MPVVIEDPFRDHRRFEWLAGALDDGEDLAGAGRKLVLLAGVAVVQVHEQVPGLEQVGEALGGERAGAGVFVFEVVADSSQGFGDGRGGTAGAAPPHCLR